jgi:hypothetical protein
MGDQIIIKEQYARMSNDELIRLVKYEEHELTSEARLMLQEELVKRRLDTSLLDGIIQNHDAQAERKVAKAQKSVENAYINSIWSYALESKGNGLPDEEIYNGLLEKGIGEEHAAMMMKSLEHKATEQLKSATNEMTWGGLTSLGGLLITYFTYTEAANGGTYVIAWGAILFGAIKFFRGLSNADKNRMILRNIEPVRETENNIEQ